VKVDFPIVPAAVSLIFLLVPVFAFGFAGEWCKRVTARLSPAGRIFAPAVLALPYLLVSIWTHTLAWQWLAIYVLVPVAVAGSLALAAHLDPEQRGHWLDFLVLIPLGLAVDLRWLEPAWPHKLALLSKLILLDAGLYGFLALRQLTNVGYDLRLRKSDWKIGLREFAFFMPVALLVGFALAFLHLHHHLTRPWLLPLFWVFSFIGTAIPEEIFFRGWMQNLLERRIGRVAAYVVTSCLFGLSHFNKRAARFNWRYVLLAALAGIFYGRAWRADRRMSTSAITHATVDTVWGALLK
jgi:uncharacterized protein